MEPFHFFLFISGGFHGMGRLIFLVLHLSDGAPMVVKLLSGDGVDITPN